MIRALEHCLVKVTFMVFPISLSGIVQKGIKCKCVFLCPCHFQRGAYSITLDYAPVLYDVRRLSVVQCQMALGGGM